MPALYSAPDVAYYAENYARLIGKAVTEVHNLIIHWCGIGA